jgi:hypothetical protein
MSFYEKGPVRIHFEEKGSGFPLLMVAGGGLNSAISNLSAPYSPFNAMEEFKYEYRCIGDAMLAPNAEVSMFPWKEPKERIPLAVRQIRSFLRAHRPAAARGRSELGC